jgi:hypothetical protein
MRSDRTARLLSRRLDELASTLEHAAGPRPPVAHLLELASVATRHAVSLELITAEQAALIWARAREAHPVLQAQRLAA